MTDKLPTGAITVVPDANALIHGRALVNMPWKSLGFETVTVAYCAPVIAEIDKLKIQAGRPSKLARKVSEDVRALIKSPGSCDTFTANDGSAVSRRLELKRTLKQQHPDLDLSHGDQNLINFCLWLGEQGQNVLLLTDDTICAVTARSVGVDVKLMDDAWRREPEPDEHHREIAALKEKIRLYEKREPTIEIGFSQPGGGSIAALSASMSTWAPLDGKTIDRLMSTIEQAFPIATDFSEPQPSASEQLTRQVERLRRFNFYSSYEEATEAEIKAYTEKEYPGWIAETRKALQNLHTRLAAHPDWPTFDLDIRNVGSQPALDVLVKVLARGSIDIENIEASDEGESSSKESTSLALSLPPDPPRGRRVKGGLDRIMGRSLLHHDLARSLALSAGPPRREDDRFYWRSGRREPVQKFELECKIWRHRERDLSFRIAVLSDVSKPAKGAIDVEVHAANLSSAQTVTLPVQIALVAGDTVAQAENLVNALIGKG